MKHIILASVVMSMAGVVYASERTSTALDSARAKLAVMGIGATALLDRLPPISPRPAPTPANPDDGWDEKAHVAKLGETLKTTRDIGPTSSRVLATAMGRAPKNTISVTPPEKPFNPTTIHVLPPVSETGALKLPTLVKPPKDIMPPAKKPVKGIDPNAIVAAKYKKKAVKKAMAATAVVHPADTADIEATTVVNVAATDDLDVEKLLDTEVEPRVPSEKQEHNMTHLQNIVGDERLYQEADWGIYPKQ